MKKLIIIALVIVASIALGIYIQQDPGYVLIKINNYAIELSFWLAVFILIISLIVIYKLNILFRYLYSIPARTSKWVINRRINFINNSIYQAILHYIEGNYRSADYMLAKAAKHLNARDNPEDREHAIVNNLLAAVVAQQSDKVFKRDKYLSRAFETYKKLEKKHHNKYELSIGIMQAKLQLENHEYESCLATLNQLQQKYKNTKVLQLLAEVYNRLNDWHSLIRLLPELSRYKVYSEEQILNYEVNAATHNLDNIVNTARKLSESGSSQNIMAVKNNIDIFYNNILSKRARLHNHVIINYVHSLYNLLALSRYNEIYSSSVNEYLNTLDKFLSEVNQKLKKDPDSIDSLVLQHTLLDLYAKVAYSNEHLYTLEKYLKKDYKNINLLFALGRIALRLHDYDKAYQYLNQSKKLEDNLDSTVRTHLPIDNYLAYVLLKKGDHESSLGLFKDYFRLSSISNSSGK